MTENIEWGACPVCGGRVTGKVDGWRSDGRLHVEQPYDEPPVCENGCPLEGFAPYIALVVECGDGKSAKEAMEKAVRREWSRMCGIATRVNPCVCGGTPVLELREGCRFLECPDCGRMARAARCSLVEAVGDWNNRMADLRKRDAGCAAMESLAKGVGLGVASTPHLLSGEELAACGSEKLLEVREEDGRYHEREVTRPFPYTDHAVLFDLTGACVYHWVLADGTVVTSTDGWTEPEHGETSQTVRTLTGHHLVIPNTAVLYVAA